METRESLRSFDAAGLAATPLGRTLARLLYGSSGSGKEGEGPFVLAGQGTNPIVLRANEDYSGGRPFVDRIEITTGRSLRDQQLDFELGKADVIELAPDQSGRAVQAGRNVAVSNPIELLALQAQSQAASEDRVRQALSAAVDREVIASVLLQRQGDPAGGLLPQWISGYAFLFPTKPDLPRARQLAIEAGRSLKLTLSYDAGDALARVVADRVALNARDAGILVQPYAEVAGRTSNADFRLLRLRVDSSEPATALAQVAAALRSGEQDFTALVSPEQVYGAEQSLLKSAGVVPIVYLPESYLLSPRVHDWVEPRSGGWPLADLWVEQP